MRIINKRRFEPGPFNLGRFGPYIGSVAVIWVVFITVSTHSCSFLDQRPLLNDVSPPVFVGKVTQTNACMAF